MMKLLKILFLCVFCVSVVNTGQSEDWLSFGKDNFRSRSTPEKLSSTFSAGWQYNGGSDIVSSPAVSDGFVIFGTRDGYVRALKESDGTPLWSFKTYNEIISSPTINKGRVYIPSTDGNVYCLRLSDGTLIWNYRTGGADISSPIILSDVLFMGSGYPNQKVIALNTPNKNIVWQKWVEQIIYSSPAIADNKVFIGCDSGRYYALDQNNGSEIWTYETGGDVLLSSPLIIDNSVYLLPGGTNTNFYRVDINSANWATSNWQTALTDPSPPVTGTLVGTKLATSSPMQSVLYGLVIFTVRFDYSVDMDPRPDYVLYEYTMNEYVIGVNPSSHSAMWQQPLGSLITSDPNSIPSLGLCPTPAEMLAPGSSILAVCSTLSSELKIIDPSDGHTISNYALDSPTRSSPSVANGRVFAGTKNGSLYAFQCDDNHAPLPPTSGFFPADNVNIQPSTPTINWDSATDVDGSPDDLIYELRVDYDNEVLENYNLVTTTNPGITSVTLLTPIPDNTRVVYAVRTIDINLAYSEWSELQVFWVKREISAPTPPTNLMAIPGNGYINFLWTASTSLDVRGYWVNWKEQGGSYGSPIFIGNVTDYTLDGLTNGVEYTFQVVAEDYDSLQSSPVEISCKPAYPITLNDIPYDTLVNALNDAQSGDTIKLSVGTFIIPYPLDVKEGINIQGFSPLYTFINGTGLTRVFSLTANNGAKGTFSKFTIYGAQIGIDTANYNAIIKNTIIRNCDTGIFVGSGSNTEIINNTIITNTLRGIDTYSAATYIRNNIIIRNGYGIYAAEPVTPSNTYNDVYGNTIANYYQCNPGIGDISLGVIFLDAPNNDYREAIDQPSIDMGDPSDEYFEEPHPHGTRINMGAYGNTRYTAISGVLHIVTTTLSDGETNAYYGVLLSTVGGSGPITWSITAGTIPSGLTLNASSGTITGTIALGSAGRYDFSVEVVDYMSVTDTMSYTILVSPAPNNNLHIATNLMPDGEVRAMYQANISAADGFTPYTWSIIEGSLPPNVILNTATGEIKGTPPYIAVNDYTFTVKVTDADNVSANKTLTIRINAGLMSGSSGSGLGKKWCFIATAAYGSPLAPSVKILQQFRDEYLLSNNAGKWVVSQYYRHSPILADYITNHNWAKKISRVLLIPAVAYSWYMVSTGLPIKILTSLLIIFCGIILIHRRRPYGRPFKDAK